jgi:hypothetical protein
MGKNQNTWSHRTKIIFREIKMIFHPLGSLAGFPARFIVLWQENVRGTRNALARLFSLGYWSWISLLLWMWFLNVRDNVSMDLKYVCQLYVIIPLLYGIVPVLYIYSLILVLYGIVQVLCIIHLLHASDGNMNIYSPKGIIFPEGNTLVEYDTRGWINVHISWTRMLSMFYYTEWNQENTYMELYHITMGLWHKYTILGLWHISLRVWH